MEKKDSSTEITFCEMREKEIVNLFDGKRLGRVLDLVFDSTTNTVLGVVVPGIKKLFSKKTDDIFIPLELIEKIGDDVILVRLEPVERRESMPKKQEDQGVYSKFQRELTAK